VPAAAHPASVIRPTGSEPRRADEDVGVSGDRMTELLLQAWRDYPDPPRHERDRWWPPGVVGGTAPTLAEAEVLEAAAFAHRRSA
jgi:hypothetical protein